MAVAQGTGSRGGFSHTVETVNTMADMKDQPSLSEGLRMGVAQAHRNLHTGLPECRNSRRANPLGNKAHVK
jgi:hypothetical protein